LQDGKFIVEERERLLEVISGYGSGEGRPALSGHDCYDHFF
jgi:hypothetical protein